MGFNGSFVLVATSVTINHNYQLEPKKTLVLVATCATKLLHATGE